MNANIRRLALATLAGLVVTPVMLAPAAAQAPTPGERWRSSMSMEMAGMKMPGQTTEVCTPKGANQAPMGDDKDCKVSNRRRSGNTESFDMACKGGMTGTMEMTQESPSRWSGKMLARTADGQMTMRMTSEKLPGDCDASEMERKMNQIQAQSADAMAKQCLASAKAGVSIQFLGPTAICKDPASVKAYCSFASTSTGYNALARSQRVGARVYTGQEAAIYRATLANTGKLCGFNPETVRTQFCSTAEKKAEWTFFAEECPELAKPIAQAQCAGRDFTTPVEPKWAKFCGAWSAGGTATAGGGAAGGATTGVAGTETRKVGEGESEGQQVVKEKASPGQQAKDAMQKSKDALKGLFGR